MINIIPSILYVYNKGCMVSPACLWIMLYYYISHLWLFCSLKIPFLRICHKIFTVGTCMIFVEERCYRVNAGLMFFTC